MITKVFIYLALLCFVLAAFGVGFNRVALIPLGLAFYMTSKALR